MARDKKRVDSFKEKKRYVCSVFPFASLPDGEFKELIDNSANFKSEIKGLKKQLHHLEDEMQASNEVFVKWVEDLEQQLKTEKEQHKEKDYQHQGAVQTIEENKMKLSEKDNNIGRLENELAACNINLKESEEKLESCRKIISRDSRREGHLLRFNEKLKEGVCRGCRCPLHEHEHLQYAPDPWADPKQNQQQKSRQQPRGRQGPKPYRGSRNVHKNT